MTELPDNHRIERRIRQLRKLARNQATVIACINSLMEILMAGPQELSDKIDELTAAIEADQVSDQAVVTTLDGVIAQLRLDGDTSGAIAKLEAAKAKITSVTSSS